MSLAVAVAADGVRIPLTRERAADAVRLVLRAEKVRDAMISIAFVTPRAIAALNFEHLGHAEPTDVISFAFAPAAGAEGTVGDVYICPEVAAENARDRGAPLREELTRLVVHGTLHVLGYDHPEAGDRTSSDMWRRQERLVERALAAAARKSDGAKKRASKTSARKTAVRKTSVRKTSGSRAARRATPPRTRAAKKSTARRRR